MGGSKLALLKNYMDISLVLRMHFEHGYSAEEICARLRHSKELVELVIQNHEQWKEEKEAQEKKHR
jgi:hypothetical protein